MSDHDRTSFGKSLQVNNADTTEYPALISRWRNLRQELSAAGVTLLAVSKYAPDSAVSWLVDAGQEEFAESRPQALRRRAQLWPACRWHMIGPLQKNKAKYIARHAAMWHSAEDVETALQVARHVTGRVLPVLLQVNLSGDTRRHGVAPGQAGHLLDVLAAIPQFEVVGLMGMAPREGDPRPAFQRLRRLRDELFGVSLGHLCMGMSGDYRLAMEEGATMVRLGSILFAEPGKTE